MTEIDGTWCFCRICAPADDEATWDDGDRKLVSDVSSHGWHLIKVYGDGNGPGWCYTIGLWHTFRSPEVAMFGLRDEDMPHWLNTVGEQVRHGAPPRPNEYRPGVLEGVDVTWRPVHDSWYPELFGYALWFTSPPLPVVQLVWPDRDGHYPWDGDVGERCVRDQPTAWEPIERQPSGPWRPMAVHAMHGWPNPEMRAFTTTRIVDGLTSVLAVFHESDDDWSFVDGGSVEREDIVRVHTAHLVDEDPSLAELSDLPPGWEAHREASTGTWTRQPID